MAEFALWQGERTRAIRGIDATCPQCEEAMIAKCGRINVHHWAHAANDCDPWYEPETAWHRGWKALFPDDRTEVSRAGHRADIVRRDGMVVELQHSPIAVDDITIRESAYGKMVWLFDGRDITNERLILRDRGDYCSFRWKHPRKHYGLCRRPVFIDLGFTVLRMNKLHLVRPPYGGWGRLLSRQAFVAWLTG